MAKRTRYRIQAQGEIPSVDFLWRFSIPDWCPGAWKLSNGIILVLVASVMGFLTSCISPVPAGELSMGITPGRPADSVSADGRIRLRRFPADTVYTPGFALLAQAPYPAKTRIQGGEVKQYKTGVFFKDLQFQEGLNQVSVEAEFPDGSTSAYLRDIRYVRREPTRPALPLWLDTTSFSPKQDWSGISADMLSFSFEGSKGQRAFLLLHPGGLRKEMARKDFADYSIYHTTLAMDLVKPGRAYHVEVILEGGAKSLRMRMPIEVRTDLPGAFPLVRSIQDKTPLSLNLGPIRLGSPLVGEFPKGIIFQTSGKVGNYYRVRLDALREGMVPESAVEVLPPSMPRPQYFLQSVGVSPGARADVVRIPYPEPVPYTIEVLPGGMALRIRLFGVRSSSTWMTHREGLRAIELVTWEQIAPETYELQVRLKSRFQWGYTLSPEQKNLVLRVNYPPVIAQTAHQQPWKGLKVSIEAGHGGWNTGAEGLSGLLEKEVNLDVSLRLEALCREAGMEVLQIRPDDSYMTLEEKRSQAERYQPHLHLSIHSNSGGGGYLGANGVSTYYHNPLWEPFAKSVYQSLLELPLKEFGMVGAFNYHVTRMSSQPSILVELAFLSHAEDEEKLADPVFRQQLAQHIFNGIENYLRMTLDKTE
jgi:N-acetylmuramoyl-L-alanine amidase